jgi:hypothetical protein
MLLPNGKPNGKLAIVDIRKLRDYCLNPDNPRGSAKARVFASALGITAKDVGKLRGKIVEDSDVRRSSRWRA